MSKAFAGLAIVMGLVFSKVPPKIPALTVDDFEREALTGWVWRARENKVQPDGSMAFEETPADKLTLFLTKEKPQVLKGKQSLQIVYEPAEENEKKEALVALVKSPAVMGDRRAFQFQAKVIKGKAKLYVKLLDLGGTVRYTSQNPVDCSFKGSKTFTLDQADFGIPDKAEDKFWGEISRVQFVIFGAATLVVDQLEFVPLPVKK